MVVFFDYTKQQDISSRPTLLILSFWESIPSFYFLPFFFYHFFFFLSLFSFSFSVSNCIVTSPVDINRNGLVSFVVLFVTVAFEEKFDSIQLCLKSFLYLVKTESCGGERNHGELGSQGFAEEICPDNVSVIESWEPVNPQVWDGAGSPGSQSLSGCPYVCAQRRQYPRALLPPLS